MSIELCFRNRAKRRERRREKRRSERRAKGFSLIELMIVLVILGLLAALVGPELMKRLEGSKVDVANTQVKMLRSALQTYRIDIGAYPVTAQGLAALMAPPDEVAEYWRGPYLQDELPDDPWRNPYQYEAPVDNLQGFFLYSFGADGARGGEGDNADIGYPPEGSP